MLTVALYLIITALVAVVFFLLASVIFGRSEELPPAAKGTTLTYLPASDISGEDVRALRFQQAVRGYRSDEVDWALGQLAAEIDRLRAVLAESPQTSRDDGH